MTTIAATIIPHILQDRVLPFLESWVDVSANMPSWVADLRSRGSTRYRVLGGVPTPKTEAWKYTSLTHLTALPYKLVTGVSLPITLPREGLLAVSWPQLVLINGRLAADLSSSSLPNGTTAQSLDEALREDDNGELMGLLLSPEVAPAMAALNTAWIGNGLVIRFESGTRIDQPLHIIFVSAQPADGTPVLVHPSLVVVAETGCRATLVESHIGLASAFNNTVAALHIKSDATLFHVLSQSGLHDTNAIGFTTVMVATKSLYRRLVLTTGLGLVRNELNVTLAGVEAECRLHGIYTADKTRHVDNTIVVNHAAQATRSRQIFKGVLTDSSRGVFQGRISIQTNAQKSNGYQIHKALLLSPQAEVDCKPELEICADDVTCSHGAVVGELDEEALFYLRSRGISANTARALLIEAFLSDTLDDIATDVPLISEAAGAMITVWLRDQILVPKQD